MAEYHSPDDSTTDDVLPPPSDGSGANDLTSGRPRPSHLGRYEIRGVIGEGAFDRVYEAFDPELERLVALQVVRPERLSYSYERGLAAFVRSARLTATIRHPNVCPIYEIGSDNGCPYLVMPHFPLGNLRGLMDGRDGPLPVPAAVDLAREAALGLSAAHALGVLHCNLKPSNVLLGTARGEAVVAGFGRYQPFPADDEPCMFGTPVYMPPEQWGTTDFGRVGPRADVYGLGCVLYEMLAGRRSPRTPHRISGANTWVRSRSRPRGCARASRRNSTPSASGAWRSGRTTGTSPRRKSPTRWPPSRPPRRPARTPRTGSGGSRCGANSATGRSAGSCWRTTR